MNFLFVRVVAKVTSLKFNLIDFQASKAIGLIHASPLYRESAKLKNEVKNWNFTTLHTKWNYLSKIKLRIDPFFYRFSNFYGKYHTRNLKIQNRFIIYWTTVSFVTLIPLLYNILNVCLLQGTLKIDSYACCSAYIS